MLNSQNDSKWIPVPELAAIYIVLCLWWGLLNRLSAIKWHIHREVVVPATCYVDNLVDSIQVMLMIWGMAVRECVLPTQPRLAM